MPKLKKNISRRIKRRNHKKGSIGLFIIIGVFTSIIIWLIVKEPFVVVINNQTGGQADQVTKHKTADKAVNKKKNVKRIGRHTVRLKGKPLTTASHKPNRVLGKDKDTKVSDVKALSLDEAIMAASNKLGIPMSFCKRKKNADIVTYNIPIDRNSLDLVYANMIYKGEVERHGGVFVKGTDNSSKQSLTFQGKQNGEKYIINLYYDSKLYATQKNPRSISIVVDDFGAIGGDLLDGFLALDKEVCFAIFPDEVNSVITMQKATAQGRETIIHVPMEPIGYPSVNPGKNAILVQNNDSEIDKLLARFIKQLPDCIGINNHMGSLATTDESVMRTVMKTLKEHRKYFLDSRTSNVSVAYSVAQKSHIRAFRNDLFLDSPNISQSTMDAKLTQIVSLSGSRSNIVAITHCHNQEKLQYLKKIVAKLKAAGFTLVPLSQSVYKNVPGIL